MDTTVSFVLGTRPEIIKLAPLIRLCVERDVPFSIVHTGQHYSENLDGVFFEQLELPVPDHYLSIGSDSHGRQTGRMLANIEAVLEYERPDSVLVQGDTNSVLAGGLAASKLDDVEVGHVEAGLRSYDQNMPEEINRRLVDHLSDHLFAPTPSARENLLAENLPVERVTVTGNTIVDAVEGHLELAKKQSDVLERLGIGDPFGLLTAHREENVDDPSRFRSLLKGVAQAGRTHDLQIIYPVHPRAEERLEEFELDVPEEIELVSPEDFLGFLILEAEARIAFTDSGGVQEEACILRTPCVTLRDGTERPETVEAGANRVVGVDVTAIKAGATAMLDLEPDWENPFGDGRAAERILETLIDDGG